MQETTQVYLTQTGRVNKILIGAGAKTRLVKELERYQRLRVIVFLDILPRPRAVY